MDPAEIVKHLPEAVGVAKVAAASIPFTGIVKRMLGPAADEVAEMWRDQVRVYRYERQVRLLEKVEKIANEAGFTPQAVPPKILFPLLEGASFEDDENLHDMWANLLANAASQDGDRKVKPGFIAILRQMDPDEAALLQWMAERTPGGTEEVDISSAPFTDGDIGVLADSLEASQLIRRADSHNLGGPHVGAKAPKATSRAVIYGIRADKSYLLTDRGKAFYESCQPPNPKS